MNVLAKAVASVMIVPVVVATVVLEPGVARAQGGATPPAYDPPPPAAAPGAAPPAPPGAAPWPAPPPAPGAMPDSWTGYPPPGYAWTPPAPNRGAVYVELRSPDPTVRIDEMRADGLSVPVCKTPCRMMLARDRVYVITGPNIRQTSRFVLPDDRAQVTLDVQPGSLNTFHGGIALLIGGVIVGYVGLAMLEVEASENILVSDNNGTSTNHTPYYGGPVLLVGLTAAVVGLVMTLSSSTSVQSSTGAVFSDGNAPPGRPRKRPAFALTARGLEF